MAKPFPKEIYVTQEETAAGEVYLEAREEGVDSESIDSDRPCAVYRLASVGKVTVAREYVERRKVRA